MNSGTIVDMAEARVAYKNARPGPRGHIGATSTIEDGLEIGRYTQAVPADDSA